MNLPDDFIFSQSSLADYADCPRRFQLRYLLGQRWPAPEVDDMLEFERRMAQGEHFHHLVHQHLVGIPPELLTKRLDDPDVSRWFDAYRRTALTDLPEKRRPEITLTVPLGDYTLLAKFDLLAIDPGGRAVILDWKTGSRIPPADVLQKRMQTIVYRYVLVKGGAFLYGGQPIPPEKVEMVYWYAEHDGATRRFPYDSAQFAADETTLLRLVDEINTRADFPLTPDVTRCRFCVYRSLCDRGTSAASLSEWESDDFEPADIDDFTLDLDQIAEIEF